MGSVLCGQGQMLWVLRGVRGVVRGWGQWAEPVDMAGAASVDVGVVGGQGPDTWCCMKKMMPSGDTSRSSCSKRLAVDL